MAPKRKRHPDNDTEPLQSPTEPSPFTNPLPMEIMVLITKTLVADGNIHSAAQLAQTSKTFYEMVIPIMYHLVIISDDRILRDFLGTRIETIYQKHSQHVKTRSAASTGLYVAGKSLTAVKHIDLILTKFHRPSISLRGLRSRFGRVKQLGLKFPIESIRLEFHLTRWSGRKQVEDGVKLLSAIYDPRHVHWRDPTSHTRPYWTVNGIIQRSETALIMLHDAVKTPWGPQLESLDVPCYGLPTPSTRARYIIWRGDRCWESSGTVPPSIIPFWIEDVSIALARAVARNNKSPTFPVFIFFNLSAWIPAIKGALEPVLSRPKMPKFDDICDSVDDPSMVPDDGDAWRRWLKKDYWGKRGHKGQGQDEQGTSSSE